MVGARNEDKTYRIAGRRNPSNRIIWIGTFASHYWVQTFKVLTSHEKLSFIMQIHSGIICIVPPRGFETTNLKALSPSSGG